MKPAAFDYVRAGSLPEAVAALKNGPADARVLAGGQTLGAMLNLRLAMPASLVDIAHIDALKVLEKQGANWVIGAAVTHATIEDYPDVSPTIGLLSHVASQIAYRAIRNRGTIGGSLCHADPAADWVSTMVLLGARLSLAGPAGTRKLPMREFMHGAFTTALGTAELLQAIEVPALSDEARWGYYRVSRKSGEFPEAIAAVVLDPERRISRIVVGALDGVPALLPELAAELAAAGTPPGRDRIGEALGAAVPETALEDLQLHAVAIRRAILQALADA